MKRMFKSSTVKRWILGISTTTAIIIPQVAFAWVWRPAPNASNQPSGVGDGLCTLAAAFQGEVAAGIATIAICTIGALACVGRVQWTTAITVGVGISVLFGASTLVSMTTILGSGCGI